MKSSSLKISNQQFNPKPNRELLLKIVTAVLVLLWIYTGLDKLLRWKESRNAFHNQTFPPELAEILTFTVPILELSIVALLMFTISKWWGYLSSILLLTVFTTYVGLIWVGAFPRVPCNCAGILESLGWTEHFILNSIFIAISLTGLYLTPSHQKKKIRDK